MLHQVGIPQLLMVTQSLVHSSTIEDGYQGKSLLQRVYRQAPAATEKSCEIISSSPAGSVPYAVPYALPTVSLGVGDDVCRALGEGCFSLGLFWKSGLLSHY